jgi:hypothetical protein
MADPHVVPIPLQLKDVQDIQNITNQKVLALDPQGKVVSIPTNLFDQDNIKTQILIDFPPAPSVEMFADVINQLPTFIINSQSILTFKSISTGLNPATYYIELIGIGKGTYGVGGVDILPENLKITSHSSSSTDIAGISSTQIIDLGYQGDDIVTSLNRQLPNIDIQDQNDGYVIITGVFQSGEYHEYLWLGVAGSYGNGGLQSIPENFKELSAVSSGIARATSDYSGTVKTDTTQPDPTVYVKETVDVLLDTKADLVGGKVPSAQLPSYVDDVLEYANFAALPATGETGKIYVTLDDNSQYRWSGSAYIDFSGGGAVVRKIEIDILQLSQIVNFEQSICNYILNLPEEERTILKDGSKVNVLVGEKLISNPLFVIFHSTNNGAILWSRGGIYNNPNIILHYSTDSGISWNTILHDYSIIYNGTDDGYIQIGNNIYSNQFYIYAENLDTSELTSIYKTASGVFIPNPYETPFKNITNPDIYEIINKGTGVIASITPDNLLLIEKSKKITNPGLEEVLKQNGTALLKLLGQEEQYTSINLVNGLIEFLLRDENIQLMTSYIHNYYGWNLSQEDLSNGDIHRIGLNKSVELSSSNTAFDINMFFNSIGYQLSILNKINGFSTNLSFRDPISNSNLSYPSKTVEESYTLATSVNRVESDIYGNINIESNFNFKYPSEFTFRPFNIYEQQGIWNIDKKPFDLISDKVSKMQAYYVDYQNGSNSNNGLSATTAFKTIIYAINTAGARLIYTRGGDIIQSDGFGLISSTSGVEDIFIIKKGLGKTFILSNLLAPIFTLDTGTTYSTSVSGVTAINVVDFKFENPNGFKTNLEVVTSLALVNSTPNSYWINTGTTTLYLNLKDGRVPDANVFILKSSSDNRIQKDGGYIYNEGLSYMGGQYAYRHRGITTVTATSYANYLAENCEYLYSSKNGFGLTDNQGVTWLNNCKAYRNTSDGFNYAQGNIYTLSKNIETFCESFDNGYRQTVSSFHNGSSAHTKHTILRVAGKYYRNFGPNVIDVFGSHSLNVGVEAFESLGINDVANNPTSDGVNFADFGDFGCGTVAGELATKMWLYGCKSKDSVLSFHTPTYLTDGVTVDTSVLYVDNSLKLAPSFGAVTFGTFTFAELENYTFSNLSTGYITPFYEPLKIRDTVVSATVTGIVADTEAKSYFIPAKTLNVNDILDIIVEVSKTGAVGTGTYKIWKNTTNSFAGATQIAIFTTSTIELTTKVSRQFTLRNNLLLGNDFTTSLASDIISTSTEFDSTSFNTEVGNYIFVSIALADADTAFVSSVKITN